MAGPRGKDADWDLIPVGEFAVIEHTCERVVIGLTPTRILKPDPYRIALMIGTSQANTVNVGLTPQIATNGGIEVIKGNNPVFINDRNMPGLAAQGLWGIANASPASVTVIYARSIGR